LQLQIAEQGLTGEASELNQAFQLQVSSQLEHHVHEAKESQEQVAVLQNRLNGVQIQGMLEQQAYLDRVHDLEHENNKIHQSLSQALSEHSMARLLETNVLMAERESQRQLLSLRATKSQLEDELVFLEKNLEAMQEWGHQESQEGG
jgi:transcriptional regulator CtsR